MTNLSANSSTYACVAVGKDAGESLGNGSGNVYHNTLVGCSAGKAITTGVINTCLGGAAGTWIDTHNNRFVLGNASVSDLYCAVTNISTSDERDKTDIETFTHGLDFVNQMRPVTYRWDRRDWYCEESDTEEDKINAVSDGSKKRAEIQIGFIGQEVQAIEKQYGYSQAKDDGTPDEDTELVVDTINDGSRMGIQYSAVVPILVNAIKELSAKVEALENE
jgi:hypothetical protein